MSDDGDNGYDPRREEDRAKLIQQLLTMEEAATQSDALRMVVELALEESSASPTIPQSSPLDGNALLNMVVSGPGASMTKLWYHRVDHPTAKQSPTTTIFVKNAAAQLAALPDFRASNLQTYQNILEKAVTALLAQLDRLVVSDIDIPQEIDATKLRGLLRAPEFSITLGSHKINTRTALANNTLRSLVNAHLVEAEEKISSLEGQSTTINPMLPNADLGSGVRDEIARRKTDLAIARIALLVERLEHISSLSGGIDKYLKSEEAKRKEDAKSSGTKFNPSADPIFKFGFRVDGNHLDSIPKDAPHLDDIQNESLDAVLATKAAFPTRFILREYIIARLTGSNSTTTGNQANQAAIYLAERLMVRASLNAGAGQSRFCESDGDTDSYKPVRVNVSAANAIGVLITAISKEFDTKAAGLESALNRGEHLRIGRRIKLAGTSTQDVTPLSLGDDSYTGRNLSIIGIRVLHKFSYLLVVPAIIRIINDPYVKSHPWVQGLKSDEKTTADNGKSGSGWFSNLGEKGKVLGFVLFKVPAITIGAVGAWGLSGAPLLGLGGVAAVAGGVGMYAASNGMLKSFTGFIGFLAAGAVAAFGVNKELAEKSGILSQVPSIGNGVADAVTKIPVYGTGWAKSIRSGIPVIIDETALDTVQPQGGKPAAQKPADPLDTVQPQGGKPAAQKPADPLDTVQPQGGKPAAQPSATDPLDDVKPKNTTGSLDPERFRGRGGADQVRKQAPEDSYAKEASKPKPDLELGLG